MPFIYQEEYKKPCVSPEHNPPNMMVLPSGEYTWQCPSCGEKTTFYVSGVIC